jgi:hypothetical protein
MRLMKADPQISIKEKLFHFPSPSGQAFQPDIRF